MRIIGGQFSGRTLLAPDSDKTRPITDRAKQSLFDNLKDCFEGCVVLDCFAGTGSMGLECLSRGASKAIFIERDRSALNFLRQNISALHMTDRAVVLPIDAYAGLNQPDITGLTVAFVDPPYQHTAAGTLRHKVDRVVGELAQQAMVDGGIISLRHPANVSVDAAGMGVKVIKELRFGDMGITWVTKQV